MGPVGPIKLPFRGSRRQSSVVETCIRNAEITFIHVAEEWRKTFHEVCGGGGNKDVKSVSKSSSVLQFHRGSEPNDRDGMSDIALSIPAMCNGASGEALVSCSRSASARSNCIAIVDRLEAIRATQPTVGVLSLNNATWLSLMSSHVSSIASHNSNRPAISKSLLVSVPFGLVSEITAAVMSCGHWTLKTVSGAFLFSPKMTPPAPNDDASVTPM